MYKLNLFAFSLIFFLGGGGGNFATNHSQALHCDVIFVTASRTFDQHLPHTTHAIMLVTNKAFPYLKSFYLPAANHEVQSKKHQFLFFSSNQATKWGMQLIHESL